MSKPIVELVLTNVSIGLWSLWIYFDDCGYEVGIGTGEEMVYLRDNLWKKTKAIKRDTKFAILQRILRVLEKAERT